MRADSAALTTLPGGLSDAWMRCCAADMVAAAVHEARQQLGTRRAADPLGGFVALDGTGAVATLPELEEQQAALQVSAREVAAHAVQRVGQRVRQAACAQPVDQLVDVGPQAVDLGPRGVVDAPHQDVQRNAVARELHRGLHPHDDVGVVRDLMRDHIGAGKIAAGAQPPLKCPEKSGIQISAIIRRAVEGPRRSGSSAAGRVCSAGEKHKFGRIVPPVKLCCENVGPNLFRVGQNDGNKLFRRVVDLVRGGSVADIAGQVDSAAAQQERRIDAKNHANDNDGDGAQTAYAPRAPHPAARPAAGPAPVFDICAAAPTPPLHRQSPSASPRASLAGISAIK